MIYTKMLQRIAALAAILLVCAPLRAVWISAETGEPIKTIPVNTGNFPDPTGHTAAEINQSLLSNTLTAINDPNHATSQGKNLFWDEICHTWKDAVTGAEVKTIPVNTQDNSEPDFKNLNNPAQTMVSNILTATVDPDHARASGINLFWEPCIELKNPKTTSTTGVVTAPLPAALPLSDRNGFLIGTYGHTSFSTPGSSSPNEYGLSGAFALPIAPNFGLQLDGDYYHLDPGNDAPKNNAGDGDAQVIYNTGTISFGGFGGGFVNDGTSTFGGGVDVGLPLGQLPLFPTGPTDFNLHFQGGYADTSKSSTDLWFGRVDLNTYITTNIKIGLDYERQHLTTGSGSFSFSQDVNEFGVSVDCYLYNLNPEKSPSSLAPKSTSAVDLKFSYIQTNFLKYNHGGTFNLGVGISFGGELNTRERTGPTFASFGQLLGLGYLY